MPRSLFLRTSIILAVLAGLAGMFYLPYKTVKEKTIKSHNAEQLLLTRQAAQDIESMFRMYGKALRYYAAHSSIIHLDKTGHRMLFDFYAVHQPALVSVARLDHEGNILHRISSAKMIDEKILEKSFSNLETGKPELIDIITPELTIGAFVWPVEYEGKPEGSLVFLVSFSELMKKYFTSLKSLEGKRLWVINRDGIVLECPNPKHSGAHITDSAKKIDQQSTLLAEIQKMVREGYAEGSFEISEIGTNLKSGSINNVAISPIILPGGNYWSIAYTTPENQVLANMTNFSNYWLLASSFALVILLLLSYSLIRSMTIAEEESKRRSVEKPLLELMDFTPIGIIVYDVLGELKYANKTAQKMWLDNTGKDIESINVFDFIHPDYIEFTKQRFKEVMRDIISEPAVIKLLFPNNLERSVEICTAPIYFFGQRCGVTVLQDVTQRLKVEEEQRRLATAVDNTNDSIVITDLHGTIQYVNPAFTRVTGYKKEEVIGKNPRMLKSGYQNEQFYKMMWNTLSSGSVWEGKLVNKKKNGSTYTELASISPIRDSKGNITHYVAVKRDISHEVQLETQLRQAQKMEAIGTLAGGIAHDFNNILGAIIGFTDISILQTPADSPVYDNLKQIKHSGQRAADLIQQILMFSRMGAQREKIHVSISPLLSETSKLLRASIPSTIDIKLDIAEHEGWIQADPVQLQQVIMNLSTNAFHAMSDTGGTLTISMSRVPLGECSGTYPLGNSSCIEIKIADTGHGIDDAIIDRIFDPFFTTKDPGVGTGMGLSVVHGIIQDLEGMITVDSSPDGTCFTILLPESEPPSVEEDEELYSVHTGTESILIVDDEKIIRDTCQKMLEPLGYKVTAYEHPTEALQSILDKENHFDLVISDQTMPEMTGLDLLQRIKEVKPGLPVILCTGYSEQLNEETALAKGASKYMMKPIHFKQLATVVRQVLDNANQDKSKPPSG